MRALLAILCTALIALGAYGAESGGFPSQPKFAAVTVGATTAATAGNVAVAGSINAVGGYFGAGINIGNNPILSGSVTAGNTLPAARVGVTAENSGAFESYVTASDAGGGVCISLNASAGVGACNMPAGDLGVAVKGGTFFLHADTGVMATDATTFTKNSRPVPTFAGAFAGGTGTCTVNTQFNFAGTCTRNSTGNYTIAVATAFASTPICTADSNTSQLASVSTTSSTSITVLTFSTAGAAQDGVWYLTCVGT